MEFPTPQEVEKANRETLARWFRLLVPTTEDPQQQKTQRKILDRVSVRFKELGGMDSALSKKIGY
jgi:hypothetical protein